MESPDLCTPPVESPKERGERKWYQRHDLGWSPARQPMSVPALKLEEANFNQVCSIAYDPDCYLEEELMDVRFYYPLLGTLWQYQSTFMGPQGDRYFMVMAVDTLPGYGIRKGSTWAAPADRFRRV
jgi:hypothetical protein